MPREGVARPSLIFEPVDQNIQSIPYVEDQIDCDQYDVNNETKTHYILRNFFDLTAHSILTSVKIGIEKDCDERTIIRSAIESFKQQIDKINAALSTTIDQS